MTAFYVTHGTADYLAKYYEAHRRPGLYYLTSPHETMLLDNTGSKKTPFAGGTTYDVIEQTGALTLSNGLDAYLFSVSTEDALFLTDIIHRLATELPQGVTYLAFGKRHNQAPYSLLIGWKTSQDRLAFTLTDAYAKLEKFVYTAPVGQLDYGHITNYLIHDPADEQQGTERPI
ncbi:hypothetical protein ACJYYY_09455 [Brochothrix campestris]|uniref:hypothetical protein n=1 Tax=Brochothrix campestris TaxID=2757 RepID=UPI0038D1FBD6